MPSVCFSMPLVQPRSEDGVLLLRGLLGLPLLARATDGNSRRCLPGLRDRLGETSLPAPTLCRTRFGDGDLELLSLDDGEARGPRRGGGDGMWESSGVLDADLRFWAGRDPSESSSESEFELDAEDEATDLFNPLNIPIPSES